MRIFSLSLLILVLTCAAGAGPATEISAYLSAEKSVQRHERALAMLAAAVEEWLSGRQGLEATQTVLRSVRAELKAKLHLPQAVATKVQSSEKQLVDSVERFLRNSSPDAAGQKALFESLNAATRDRALGLLQWRASRNQALAKQYSTGARAAYFAWEAGWLTIWKEEVQLTYRLQKAFLDSQGRQAVEGKSFVRELLALQSKADKLAVPASLSGLSELAVRRLTLLARAAEQLDRVGAGSRGALTRLRKLNREQMEADRQLQDKRLETLSKLSKA